MLGNLWLSSAFIVTAIFSAGAMYKSYSDVQEAKQVQEHYEIVSKIKTILAKQYNKNPQDITREEIIAFLPSDSNWDKVLLLNRNSSSNLDDNSLINANADIEISEDEKLKILALKAIIDLKYDEDKNNYTYTIGENEKNNIINDIEIEKALTRAVDYLAQDILYGENTSSFGEDDFDDIVEEIVPYYNIYFFDSEEETSTEIEIKTKKEEYFKKKLIEKLKLNKSVIETKLYEKVKDYEN